MPTKPLDQLTPAYRKRIERGLAKGKTRQQARGKKPGEHIIRKERAKNLGDLDTNERQQIRKFAKQQSNRDKNVGADESEELAQEIMDWTRKHGWNRFKEVREYQRRFEKNYKSHKRQFAGGGKKKGQGLRDMQDYINSQFKMNDPPPVEWFFYK